MTTIYERDLMPPLARAVGDTDSSNLHYGTDQLFSAVNDGYKELNRRGYKQQFTVTGSGDNAYFVPDPNIDEQRLLVLCSTLVLTEGEIARSARNAVVHGNVAGRTDLTTVPLALTSIRRTLDKDITDTIDRLNQRTDSISDSTKTLVEGEELKSSDDSTADNYAEGLVRVSISRGV